MLDDLVNMREWKKPQEQTQIEIQTIKHITLNWEGELLADTNLATLTIITDFYKSNKHAIWNLRAVVQDTS